MNNEKYNDFDELYDVFMEAGSDEWLLPECGVEEKFDSETMKMLKDFEHCDNRITCTDLLTSQSRGFILYSYKRNEVNATPSPSDSHP